MFRFSVCSEIFQGWPFADAVRAAVGAGFRGMELACFTLGEDATEVEAARRREYRTVLESEGLEYVGLHWLLTAPRSLHVTTPDRARRKASWDYVRRLIDLSSDLGPDGVMVFGSPKQRSTTGGITPGEAARYFAEGMAGVADHAAGRGVMLLIEALSPDQTDVITSLAEAAAMVREIGHPNVRTMFDTHNAVRETEAHDRLVDCYFDLIRHIHINERDGKHPGRGDYDFLPVMRTLDARRYGGWVSVEAFDFSFGAETIMAETLRHMHGVIGRIAR
ncbi:MAG: sugar phosphate isomerase/epimerase [Bryobacterales bacterium]|nr:sugar phosphate isomerase/epimerase [Bryobacterales bacterium]